MNRAWIELDSKALLHNLNLIKGYLHPDCKIMSVVKANAYGHGACIVANLLARNGIQNFAVATAEEGVELRKSGLPGQILVLGYTSPEKIVDLLHYDITQTIVSEEYADQLIQQYRQSSVEGKLFPYGGTEKKLCVHIALDTGMHRVGINYNNIEAIARIYQHDALQVTGIFSHLCVADSNEPEQIEFTNRQIQLYYQTLEILRERGISVTGTHIQNSYACVNYTPQPCDYARPGLLTFGVRSNPQDYLAKSVDLWPVMSLRARVTSVREVAPGETVGYGRAYRADKQTKIASVSIGYADGIPRNLGEGKLRAIVRGTYVNQIGRICMDQLMLDVTKIPNVKIGDVVTFIGNDGNCSIRAEELAENSGTITNEILSRLGRRLENIGYV